MVENNDGNGKGKKPVELYYSLICRFGIPEYSFR